MSVRVVAIGDVGVVDGMVHIGDEAMFEQFVDRMRARGVTDLVGLSSAPEDTSRRYGVEAVPQVGFDRASPRVELAGRLDRVVREAAAVRDRDHGLLPADDPALTVIEAIRSADAVVITGGGNLSSTWPANVYERAAVAEIARTLGRPLVVTGQTLGPDLAEPDATLVGQLLRSARLVGVREQPSEAVAARLGVAPQRLQRTADDAAFLAPAGGDGPPAAGPPVLAVSLSTHVGAADRDAFAHAYAHLLDAVSATTGLPVAFVPHFGALVPGDRRGDTALHDAVHATMSTPDVRHVIPTTARAAVAVARSAGLVITSRYHPGVFATAAAVPTIGISVDAYTSVKLTGALAAFGQSAVLTAEEVLAGRALDTVAGVWRDREGIRARGLALAAMQRPVAERWWDRVVDTVIGRRR